MNTPPKWDRIQGIVLDAVGTLIKPTPSVAEAYARAAARQGVVLDVGKVKGRFQAAFRDDLAQGADGALSTNEAVESQRWRAIVARVLPEIPDPDQAFEELWAHFGDPASWRAFPDSAPALEAIQEAGFRVCIGSNFDARLHPVIAGLPELADLAETIVVSSEVGYRKPHEAFFQVACRRLGLPVDRVLSVGDDLENDVLGARRAGLWAVHLTRGEASEEPFCVAELTELTRLRGAEA